MAVRPAAVLCDGRPAADTRGECLRVRQGHDSDVGVQLRIGDAGRATARRTRRLARHLVAEVDDSGAEGAGLDEFEIHPALTLGEERNATANQHRVCLLYTSPSPRDS